VSILRDTTEDSPKRPSSAKPGAQRTAPDSTTWCRVDKALRRLSLGVFLFKSDFFQVAAQTRCNPANGFEVFRRKGIDKEAADQPEMRR
jgi:hypothetical protein